MAYDDRGVSHSEFSALREIVYSDRSEFRTGIAVLRSELDELSGRAHAIPVWLQLTVGLAFPVVGTFVTLFLAGRL
jgi:hypothetical protein